MNDGPKRDPAPIGLQEAITSLRSALAESIAAGANEDIRFEVGQITLELSVEVERSTEGNAGLKFWVVDIGGSVGRTGRSIHKVTVPLTPRIPGGGPVLTGRG